MSKQHSREHRRRRVRKKISGTEGKPRLSVFRSNKHIYVQVIDDNAGKTLASFSDVKLAKADRSGNPQEVAKKVGNEIGKKLKSLKISRIVFDRSGYKYHGRVKQLAEGVREAGLTF